MHPALLRLLGVLRGDVGVKPPRKRGERESGAAGGAVAEELRAAVAAFGEGRPDEVGKEVVQRSATREVFLAAIQQARAERAGTDRTAPARPVRRVRAPVRALTPPP